MPDIKSQMEKFAKAKNIDLEQAAGEKDRQKQSGKRTAPPEKKKMPEGGLLQQIRIDPNDPKNFPPGRRSHAPYNFIPLNHTPVPAEHQPATKEKDNDPGFSCYNANRLTGRIQCTLTAQTPIYIRATIPEKAYEQGKKSRQFSDFFSPAGQVKIPGSSFRGMVRTLVEIVSFGKFTNTNDTKLYFRAFTDKAKRLEESYRENMIQEKEKLTFSLDVKAGYLAYAAGRYWIYPAIAIDMIDKEKNKVEKLQHFRVREQLLENAGLYPQRVWRTITNRRGDRVQSPNPNFEYHFDPVIFKCDEVKAHQPGQGALKLWYADVTEIKKRKKEDENNIPEGWHEGWLVCSGFAPKKRRQWVISKRSDQSFEVSVDNYRNDVNRDAQFDLLKKLDDYDFVPCFYTYDRNKQVSFGHTGMFRLNYEKSIIDHVPENLQNPQLLDLAENLFGVINEKNDKIVAGKVNFEDAVLCKENNTKMMDESVPEILGSPKPTTFQHYLVQDTPWPESMHTYNSEQTAIRGYKHYWHRKRENEKAIEWCADEIAIKWDILLPLLRSKNLFIPPEFQKGKPRSGKKEILSFHSIPNKNLKNTIAEAIKQDEKCQNTVIRPMPAGTAFHADIHFENLSKVELGALLFALNLPDDCCHKLGMAKPLGLGSVKITPALYLSNRKKRYESLAAEWSETPDAATEACVKKLIGKFESYVLEHIDEKDNPEKNEKLWQTPRLQALQTMLDWKNTGLEKWNMRTDYHRDPRQFTQRQILPTPEDVVAS